MRYFILCFTLAFYCIAQPLIVFAAEKIDVSQQAINYLQAFLPKKLGIKSCKTCDDANNQLQERNRERDVNQTLHIRAKQMFAGYPVWGGDIVVHVPASPQQSRSINLSNAHTLKDASMNGILYQHLQQDLEKRPAYIFNSQQAAQALTTAITAYQQQKGIKNQNISHQSTALIVYVDNQQKAHWAFHVSFYMNAHHRMPAAPHYIMDAVTFSIYKSWNEIKTLDAVKGGGYGGNLRTGKLLYDGVRGHLPQLSMERDPLQKICYLQNEEVVVKTYEPDEVAYFTCNERDKAHQNMYWNEVGDYVNGGYSPNNDALFAMTMTAAMYKAWYDLPVLMKDGKPSIVRAYTHSPNRSGSDVPNPDSAYYDGIEQAVFFGDGRVLFYPLASIDVGAHELSHGFTEQHSGLVYDDQSGGLNESFSDMAVKAVEYFTFKKNRWDVGANVKKEKGKALRYMDKPSKDCKGNGNAFDCSIDDMSQYHPYLELHQISGIFNRVFYLIATAPDWDTRKAFNIMVKANINYWIPNTTFEQAACGVIKAAQDYNYDLKAVKQAFHTVRLNINQC